MGYHVLDPEDVESTGEYPCDRRSLSEAAGLSNLAAAVYTLAPGEQLSQSYHYHEQREELFYVLEGILSVETPDEEYEVPAGAIFVVEPNSPLRPYNPDQSGGPVRVLGVGAPQYDIGRSFDPATDGLPGSEQSG